MIPITFVGKKGFFAYIKTNLAEPVAQLVEQRPFKAWAVRSNRTGFTSSVKS